MSGTDKELEWVVNLWFYSTLIIAIGILLVIARQHVTENGRVYTLKCGDTLIASDGSRWTQGQKNGVWRSNAGTYAQHPGEICSVTYYEK